MKKCFASAVLVAWALPALAQTPFHDTPAAVPGTIEAEDYDNGGSGVAYFDTTAGNSLGMYRADDVDIEGSTEHNFDVGKVRVGEWLKYTVNVGAAGSYRLDVRVSCLGAGGAFHIEFNDINVTGRIDVPDTGGWQTWQTLSRTVTLNPGVQIMKVVADTASVNNAIANWNYYTLTASPSTQITFIQWNIDKGREDCGAQPHSQCTQNNLDEIAQYLSDNGADVVSLNEVEHQNPTYQYEDQPDILEHLLEQKTHVCWDRHFVDMTGAPDGMAGQIIGNLLLWRSSDDSTCGQAQGRFHKQSSNEHALPSVPDPRSVGSVTLIWGTSSVTFFTTHLCAPPNANPSCTPTDRQTQVADLKMWLDNFTGPRVGAGDFNASPGSSELSAMTAAYTDVWAEGVNSNPGKATPAGNLNQPTHNNGAHFDYIFRPLDPTPVSLVSVAIEPQHNAQTGFDVSDHFPVRAILSVQ